MIARLTAISKFRSSRRGNVLMIFAFAMVPLVFATGMGVDYARAARLQTKLNALADAAALAAVTQPMMLKSEDEAKQAATKMFNAQAGALGHDLIYDPDDLTVTITASDPTATLLSRTVKVAYRAESRNAFGGILGRATLSIAGSATAYADKAPYIDFYLLLDTSPSMLLPSTSDGLVRMRTQTATSHLSSGCAFACHTANPHMDDIYIRDNDGKEIWLDSGGAAHSIQSTYKSKGVTYVRYYNGSGALVSAKESNGDYADSYWLAYNNLSYNGKPNIEMRIDAEQEAVRELVPIAKQIADENEVTYRMAVNRFDYYGPTTSYGQVASLTSLDSDSNVQSVVTKSTNLPMTSWYRNSCLTASNCVDDQSTDFKTALNQMDDLMRDPGSGATSSDPQEVMFIITDGMSDEYLSGMGRTHRELQPTHIDQCNAIKARNIRIAILYTEYLPDSLTGNSWSQSNVAPYLNKVAPALQKCASPGLYQKVSTDDSISDALTALFKQAVATAHLTR